jgi:antitoxin component YwqK of YwqJK toxin-antitoxin module
MVIKKYLVKGIVLCLLLPLYLTTACQTRLINSGELLQKAAEFNDSGMYKNAIGLYRTISRSDTNYLKALNGLSTALYSDSDYSGSLAYAKQGLSLFPNERTTWYNLCANALNELGKSDEALSYYDSIIHDDPNHYLSLYNKATVLFKKGRITDARKSLERCLLINPYYSPAHYLLGNVYEREGNLSASILAYITNLAVFPGNKYQSSAIKALGDIASVRDEVLKAVNDAAPGTESGFELQQEILLNKIALDSKYQLQSSVEDPITRQLQVLLEKLQYTSTGGFVMEFYVPFYSRILADGKFNALVNHVFGKLDIESIAEFHKKNKKEIDAVVLDIVTYFTKIRDTRILVSSAREQASVYYLFEDGVCTGKGLWKKVNDQKKLHGLWEFYYENGKTRSRGTFSEDGEKNGDWLFYFQDGTLKEKTFYTNGKAQGKSQVWYDNGLLRGEYIYKNDQLNGPFTEYYYNGVKKSDGNYENDAKNGLQRRYRTSGELQEEVFMKSDKNDGISKTYYLNGQLESSQTYLDGKIDGKYTRYFEDGKLASEGTYKKGKADGDWKIWFPSGKTKQEYGISAGELNGPFKEYYETGVVKHETLYNKGKIVDFWKFYYPDGKIRYVETYASGNFSAIKYYDKQGGELYTGNVGNGGTIYYYNDNGVKEAESTFDKNGEKEGPARTLFVSGNPSAELNYSKGLLNGMRTQYYLTGIVSEKINYTDDEQDGYYQSFFPNGKLKYEGWIVQGLKQGPHYEYNLAGNLIAEYYYRNNDQDGYTVYYYPDGRKNYEERYEEGWLKQITQFDSTGKVLSEAALTRATGDMIFRHANGKAYMQFHYDGYLLNGKSAYLYYDGRPFVTQYYKHGVRDSTFTEWFYEGTIRTAGSFNRGNRTGEWKYFYSDGQLSLQEVYKNGEQNGKSVSYNEDGSLDFESPYTDNQVTGVYKMYSVSNQPALSLIFDKDVLTGYINKNPGGNTYTQPVSNGSATIVSYYPDGIKSAEMVYEQSIPNGIRRIYFPNGKLYLDETRVVNNINGRRLIYYPAGQVFKDTQFYFDARVGVSMQYYPSGKKKREETWYYDELHGPTNFYDENGNVTETRDYYYGKLLSVKK